MLDVTVDFIPRNGQILSHSDGLVKFGREFGYCHGLFFLYPSVSLHDEVVEVGYLSSGSVGKSGKIESVGDCFHGSAACTEFVAGIYNDHVRMAIRI